MWRCCGAPRIAAEGCTLAKSHTPIEFGPAPPPATPLATSRTPIEFGPESEARRTADVTADAAQVAEIEVQ